MSNEDELLTLYSDLNEMYIHFNKDAKKYSKEDNKCNPDYWVRKGIAAGLNMAMVKVFDVFENRQS